MQVRDALKWGDLGCLRLVVGLVVVGLVIDGLVVDGLVIDELVFRDRSSGHRQEQAEQDKHPENAASQSDPFKRQSARPIAQQRQEPTERPDYEHPGRQQQGGDEQRR
jgi:hypothetical protein